MTQNLPLHVVPGNVSSLLQPGFDLLVQSTWGSAELTFLVGACQVVDYANPAALQRLGTSVQGRDFGAVVHAEDLPGLRGLLEQAAQGRDVPIEAVRLHDGSGGWHKLTGRIAHLNAGPAVQALLVQLQPPQDLQREAISRISRALGSTYTLPDVVDTILTTVLDAVGAAAGAVRMLSADGLRLELTGYTGYSEAVAATWGRCDLDADLPVVHAIRQCQPLFLHEDEFRVCYPVLHRTHVVAFQSAAVLPLMTGNRTIGALTLSFDHDQSFGPENRAFLTTVADLCAPALDRGRLQRELRQEQE